MNNLAAPIRSVENIKSAGPLIQGDVTNLPFAAESFSKVVGNRLPYSADFAEATAQNAFRVLEPGGEIRVFSSSGGGGVWLEPLKKAGFQDVRLERGVMAVGVN